MLLSLFLDLLFSLLFFVINFFAFFFLMFRFIPLHFIPLNLNLAERNLISALIRSSLLYPIMNNMIASVIFFILFIFLLCHYSYKTFILWGYKEELNTKSFFTSAMEDLTLEELPMLLEQLFSHSLVIMVLFLIVG